MTENGIKDFTFEIDMEINSELSDAKSAAQSFFNEMLVWEEWSAILGPHNEETNAKRYHKLKEIFSSHLAKKALTRRQSRYDLLSFDTPSDFSEPITKVEISGSKSAWVYTKRGPLDGLARYQLKNENGYWKVEFLEVDAVGDEDWKRSLDL